MVRKEFDWKAEQRQVCSQIEACLFSGSEEEVAKLGTLKLELSYLFKDFHKQVDAFKQKIAKMPLSVFIASWIDILLGDKTFGTDHLKILHDLLEAKLLPLSSLEAFICIKPYLIIENIRCFSKWSISRREECISAYSTFICWLSQDTFDYVSKAVDLDRIASQKRQVSFETYINILSHLDLRECILAKMFYLGGNRGLEEVLSVKIEDVDFKKGHICLEEEVSYPRHLFEDIKNYIEDRKKGYVFMGKDGERISHTTPFRALKKVVSDLKLDPEFTFRELTKNV